MSEIINFLLNVLLIWLTCLKPPANFVQIFSHIIKFSFQDTKMSVFMATMENYVAPPPITWHLLTNQFIS